MYDMHISAGINRYFCYEPTVSQDIGYCHLEKLHNLEALPDAGFTVACFPVKIKAASAGWTRAVAILDGHE